MISKLFMEQIGFINFWKVLKVGEIILAHLATSSWNMTHLLKIKEIDYFIENHLSR